MRSFIASAIISAIAVTAGIIGSAQSAEAFWTDKRNVCAQAAAEYYTASLDEFRVYWRRLGIKANMPENRLSARHNIRTFCEYYK